MWLPPIRTHRSHESFMRIEKSQIAILEAHHGALATNHGSQQNDIDRNPVAGPTDGTPIVYKGPTVPDGFVVMYKADGDNKMSYTIKYKDKVTNAGVVSVSEKLFTDTSWIPEQRKRKSTAVYNQQ